jgi:hypothetical protein
MELRKHAFMWHGWVSLWPPQWTWISGEDNTNPVGEVGLLESIRRSDIDPNACYLTMSHAGASYVGVLHYDRVGFCHLICERLPSYYGRPIQEIAALDIP